MFENTYKSMSNQIKPEDVLIYSINKAGKVHAAQLKRVITPFYRRLLSIATVLILCIVLGTPVLATYVPSIYELMYLVSPQTAQFFVPVQESCENNGIRMEVISTNIHDTTAEIYITLQDLTGDRIDDTTDLFDSYSIHRSFDSSATCKRVGYDADTKTATFLIQIDEWGSQEIEGSKLTFSVREFLSHKKKLEDTPVEIDLAAADKVFETQKFYSNGGSGYDYSKYVNSSNYYDALIPGNSIYTPIKGLDVTAVGYVNEILRIQMKISDSINLDNHGFFYLLDKDGNKIQSDCSVYFTKETDTNNRVNYVEFMFGIPQDEIGSYKLFGSFYTSGMNTKGNWRVTFPLSVSQS